MDKGYILDNRYEIIDILGSGGMGRVYLGRNIMLGTLWAIKELRHDTDGADNVLAEVELLKDLDHPALPKVFEIIEDYSSYYIVFTYIKGTSLSNKLAKAGCFSEKNVIDIGIALCDVLTYLHTREPKPIIYRDLKPSNIILSPDGSIKLVDFGIAREFKEENAQDTVFIGTRGYAAPEQYGEGQSGQYTDIYSLGVTLKQLLTGKSPLEPPYGLGPVRRINPEVSKKLEQILEKCTVRDINGRYKSAGELKKEFEALTGRLVKSGNRASSTDIPAENIAFYKQIVVSLDNAVFAGELAVGASMAGLAVILIDAIKYAPVCDYHMGISKKYKEHRIMAGLEPDVTESLVDTFTADIGKYIYSLSSAKGLNYMAINIANISSEVLQRFLNIIRMRYDVIIFNTSINLASENNKALFQNADKILIADSVSMDKLDYWRRTLDSFCRKYETEKNIIFYIGWLWDRSRDLSISIARQMLAGFNFYAGISYRRNRLLNINNCAGPAFINYGENESEYESIMHYLNMAPVKYVRKQFGRGIFGLLNKRRG